MEIVARLRSPAGCPWDREQDRTDIARYLIEESYEVVEAIEDGSPADLREELGDLLFHIIFLADLAEEQGDFDLSDIMSGIEEKMIRRHPHVFGHTEAVSVAAIKENWEAIKIKEGKGHGTWTERLGGLTRPLPALIRAQKITKAAAKMGLDWEKTQDVLEKVDEELLELKEAIKTCPQERIVEEMGDLLFSLVNLCRFLDVDAETSLRNASHKFIRRLGCIEQELLASGRNPSEVSSGELDRLWEEAKVKKRS